MEKSHFDEHQIHDTETMKQFVTASGKWEISASDLAHLSYKAAERMAQHKEHIDGGYKDYANHAFNIFIQIYKSPSATYGETWLKKIQDIWHSIANQTELDEDTLEDAFYTKAKTTLAEYPAAWASILYDYTRYVQRTSFDRKYDDLFMSLNRAMFGKLVLIEDIYTRPEQRDVETFRKFILCAQDSPWSAYSKQIAEITLLTAGRIATHREHINGVYTNYIDHAAGIFRALNQTDSNKHARSWLKEIASAYKEFDVSEEITRGSPIDFHTANSHLFNKYPEVWVQIAYDVLKYNQYVAGQNDESKKLMNTFDKLRGHITWDFKDTEHLRFEAA